MGFKVGMPVLKLVTGKGNGKRSANYRKILQEMGNERFSKSKTLDRTRSVNNVYMGFSAGGKCADAMDDVLSTYRVKVHKADGTVQERAMRSNQVVGFSWVLKPPVEVTSTWDAATWKKFLSDSLSILEEICPELFGGCSELTAYHPGDKRSHVPVETGVGHNLMMMSEQYDEGGRHLHGAGMVWTPDGRLCGKEVVCLPTFAKLNRTYPQRMQELGWDVEELRAYDEAEAEKDPDYKAKHIAKKKLKKHGLSVNDYAARKEQEAALHAAEARLVAEERLAQVLQEELESQQRAEAAIADASALVDEAQAYAEAVSDVVREDAREQSELHALVVMENAYAAIQAVEDERSREYTAVLDHAAEVVRQAAVGEYNKIVDEATTKASEMLEDATTLTDEQTKVYKEFERQSKPESHSYVATVILRKAGSVVADFVDSLGYGYEAETIRDVWEKRVIPNAQALGKKIVQSIWPTKEQRQAKQRAAEHASKLDAFKVRLRSGAAGAPVSDVGRDGSSTKSAISDALAQGNTSNTDKQFGF